MSARRSFHVEEAHADRRADPFVQVEADEIDLELAHPEVDLPPGMGGVEDDVDAFGPGHARDLRDRHDEAGAMADMGEEEKPGLRIRLEGAGIGVEHALAGGRLRHIEPDHVDPAARPQRVHGILHRVVVEVGVEHAVARLQLVVATDEELQRFGRAAGQRDLLGRRADRLRHPGAHGLEIRPRALPRIVGVLIVDHVGLANELAPHRLGHDAPIAVLQIDDIGRHGIESLHGRPIGLVGGDCGRRSGRLRRQAVGCQGLCRHVRCRHGRCRQRRGGCGREALQDRPAVGRACLSQMHISLHDARRREQRSIERE